MFNMGKGSILIVAVAALPVLCGCAVDRNVSYAPEFLKQPGPKQAAVEQPPDVRAILRGNLIAVFTEASSPTNIRYSFPVPAKYGGWNSCIQGSVTSVTGRSIGAQTFLVDIDHDKIGARTRVGSDHWCARETYQPL